MQDREAEKKQDSPNRKDKNKNHSNNKNRSIGHNVHGVEERKAEMKGIKKQQSRGSGQKTAPFTEKQHVTQWKENKRRQEKKRVKG